MLFSSLDQALRYIESVHPKQIDLTLSRVQSVATALTLNQFSCPVITVAGTNGKGSSVAILDSLYSTEGYRVGTYTSPHLVDFCERVRIKQSKVTPQAFCDALSFINAVRGDIRLTYFEFVTLAAFHLLQQAELDVIILEVGLGGRLDAVNCVAPDLSLLTTIALDHQSWLGDTREAIAKEKAGIMRANTPCVCGDFYPPSVIAQQAQSIGAPLFLQNRDFHFCADQQHWSFQSETRAFSNLPIPSLALQNAASCLMAVECLQTRLPVSEAAIRQGLQTVHCPGRLESFKRDGINIILDVSHNPASIERLAAYCRTQPVEGLTRAVFGILKDKAIKACIELMIPIVAKWYISSVDSPRSATVSDLTRMLVQAGQTHYAYDKLVDAFEHALAQSKNGDRIVVFGSFHTIAKLRNYDTLRIDHE